MFDRSQRNSPLSLRLTVGAAIAGTALIAFVSGFLVDRYACGTRRGRYADTKPLVGRYLREFNAPRGVGYRGLWEQFVDANPGFVNDNEYNRGSELLYAALGNTHWSTDTDRDGRREAADELGEPLIVLTEQLTRDTIVQASGHRYTVIAPPYFRSGTYINLQAFHCWFIGDQEALEQLLIQP